MIVRTLLQSVRHLSKSCSIGIAIATLAILASSSPAIADTSTRRVSFQTQTAPSPVTAITPKANGVYLYGEADRPDVLGKEYMIFETTGNRAIGAFYLPQSEFSCFYGQFKGSRLHVSLIDAYDSKKYDFSLALNPNSMTASKQAMMGEPTYYPLGTKISSNEQRILNTCKQQLRG